MTKRQGSSGAFTVSADLVRGIVDCAVRSGLDAARFSDLLSPQSAAPPEARYGSDFLMRVWGRVVRVSGDPNIGFTMAHKASPGSFGVLAQILPRCATVLDIFRQAQRYSALASSGSHLGVELGHSNLTVLLTVDAPAGDVERAIVMWLLTNLSVMPQRFTGQRIRPVAVECALSEPPPRSLRELQTHAPYVFGSGRNAVTFRRSVAELTVPTADVGLKGLLLELMDQRVATLARETKFEESVASVMQEMLNGTMPSLTSLSARAGIPQRTLQRRLAAAGTTFEKLRRRVLQQRADDLLTNGKLTQGEVAFLLGYSEVSAFSRAYRKWRGAPPGRTLRQSLPRESPMS